MAWLKLDDQIFLNRKVAQCDANTKLLYIVGLSYCANQLTDGYIPETTLPLLAGMAGLDWQIAKQSAGKLLDVCLWIATQNGWQIPDYLDYNPSRDQVKHNQHVRSEAGKRGGYAKNKQNAGNLPSKTQAKPKQNSGKILPPPPSPSPYERDEGLSDPAFGEAISKLEALGMMTGNTLLEFQALWLDLGNGRREWIDDAVMIAQANRAKSPAYAVRVLAGAVRDNRRPGQAPERKQAQRPQGHNLRELLRLDEDD